MEKFLGLEYEDIAEREQYIKDNADSIENMGNIISRMKAENITIYDGEIDKEQQAHMSQINALFYVRLPQKQQHTEILARLSMLDGIISIEEV